MSCLIEIDNLSFTYPDGLHALKDVSVHIQHGERVGLVGPNGAGKTTLFLVMAGVMHPYEGSVQISGCDVSTPAGRKEVHQKVGIVFQNSDDQLFNASVQEDIAFGPLNMNLARQDIEQRVDEALHSVGLNDSFKSRLPFHLSGGEKRRVAIAGVLAMKPHVLLLDEPSSDLDPRGRRELIGILNRLSISRIISTHDLEFVLETCDKVIVFHQGRVVAAGKAADILAQEELMLNHGLEVPLSLRMDGKIRQKK